MSQETGAGENSEPKVAEPKEQKSHKPAGDKKLAHKITSGLKKIGAEKMLNMLSRGKVEDTNLVGDVDTSSLEAPEEVLETQALGQPATVEVVDAAPEDTASHIDVEPPEVVAPAAVSEQSPHGRASRPLPSGAEISANAPSPEAAEELNSAARRKEKFDEGIEEIMEKLQKDPRYKELNEQRLEEIATNQFYANEAAEIWEKGVSQEILTDAMFQTIEAEETELAKTRVPEGHPIDGREVRIRALQKYKRSKDRAMLLKAEDTVKNIIKRVKHADKKKFWLEFLGALGAGVGVGTLLLGLKVTAAVTGGGKG